MKDEFLYNSLVLLTNQTRLNPPYYVSHGTDHSVRVMGWQYKLKDMINRYISDLYGCVEAEDSLGVNGSCTFNLMLNGLLHDTGKIWNKFT